MGMMEIRRKMMKQNMFTPNGIVAYRPNNTSVTASDQYVRIEALSNTYGYHATTQPVSNYDFTEGKTYIYCATVADVTDNNSVKISVAIRNSSGSAVLRSNEISNPKKGDTVRLKFTYDSSTYKALSLYMNNSGALPIGSFVKFKDITVI